MVEAIYDIIDLKLTLILFALNLICYIYTRVYSIPAQNYATNFIFVFQNHQYWRLVVSCFNHASIVQLFLDLFLIWDQREMSFLPFSLLTKYYLIMIIVPTFMECFIGYTIKNYSFGIGYSQIAIANILLFSRPVMINNRKFGGIEQSIVAFLVYHIFAHSNPIRNVCGILTALLYRNSYFDFISPSMAIISFGILFIFFVINYIASYAPKREGRRNTKKIN